MINILSSVASNAPIIDALSQNGNLRMIAVQGNGFDAIDQRPELQHPGIYICIGPDNRLYVGYSGTLIVRTWRLTAGPVRPPFLMFIVGNDQPLEPENAAVLERIAFQALFSGGHNPMNRRGPYGKLIDLETYSKLQQDWASLIQPLCQIVPALACAWIEPTYARVPKEHPDDAYLEEFLEANKRNMRATIKRIYEGYVIQPGSMIRRDPAPRAKAVRHIQRIESRYCGLLVPDRDQLRLTRPVFRRTLSACSQFAFTITQTGIWEPIRDQLPPTAA